MCVCVSVRTFIMPGQLKRKKNVKKKLNPIKSVFAGKVRKPHRASSRRKP
jgi:hypothetical protein